MDDPDPADSIFSLPFTASLGPVGPLLRQLRSLTTPPEGASRREVRNLTKDLDVLCSSLMAHSQAEEPSSRVKSWMSEIRELCYDTKNYLDDAPFILKQDDYAQLTPKDKKKIARLKFKTLKSRANHARKRRKRYQIDPQSISNAKFLSLGPRRLPVLHPELIDRGRMDILANMLGTAEEKPLKVVSLVGLEGVGKTTLAKRIYHQTGQQFQCGAFVKVSPKPDMRMLLTSIFTQIQLPGFSEGVSEPACSLDAQDLITNIRQYLQDKRYLIIMDDLWSISVWDIITRAFPDDSHGSRIITTTQLEDVASACCSYQSKYIYQIKPLKVEQSKKLFSGMVFGSEDQGGCSEDFVSVSDVIISKCGRLPLLLANIASLLPTLSPREINLQQWEVIRDSLPSTLRRNPSSEGIKEVLNLIYNKLSPELKTCLLYLAMYPEGYTIKKDDLVKQWVSEGFTGEGQHKEEIARNYFDELVRRGMIQAADIDYRGVLSCTLHRKVHELIVRKSMEGNFIIGVENFQSSIWLPHKVRRLSIQFGGARSARIPAGITLSEVRSLSYFGFYGCTDFIEKCKLLQQITLHVWADATYDLSGISKLLPLRYLKIACNTAVKLPDEIQALQYLETLEVDATVQAIPSGIGGLSRLSSLKIAVRVLTRQDICILQAVPALAALSLHVSAEPAEMIVFDKGGFSLLEYLKFRSSVPSLNFEAGSMPSLRNLNLCFNAHEAEQRRIVPIGIEHLSGLREITANIWGAHTDVGSAFKTAISNHPSNPRIDVQLVDRIFHGEDAKKQPAGRMPTLLGSSSRVPVPGYHADEQNLLGKLYNAEIVESLEAPYLSATQMEKQQLAIGHNGQDGEISVKVEHSSLDQDPLPLPAMVRPAASGTIQPQAGKVQDGEITLHIELASLGTQPPPAVVTPEKGTIPAVEGMAVVDMAWFQPPTPAAVTPAKGTIPAMEGRRTILITPMEVALLSAVMKAAANKLLSLIGREFASTFGLCKDLCELQGLFGDITAWLSVVEYGTADSSSSPNWLRQLKVVVNDFDDMLYRLEADKHKVEIASENHVMVNWFYTKPKAVMSHTKMVQEIKEIKKRFARIVKQRTEFNAIASSASVTHHVQPTHKTIGEMSILTNTTDVIGRDEVKYSIISMLVGADVQERISIVSIVGLGGSGKTTLAKYICQDGKIKKHFEVVFWVHVSQEFNVQKLLGKLFEYVSSEKSELHTLQHMSKTISEKLSTRKFLLILDDVWNRDKHDWEQFEQHLNSGKLGSKILITTRDKYVAEVVKSVEVVNLAVLSDDDSWKLFQQSSGWAEEELEYEFIEVGKEIVKKCGGIPMAIESLAGSLHGKRDIKEWRSLRDGNLLANKDIQQRVLESLKLSYFHLSDDLKQCFVLCCIFPKGYCIDKEHLISLWIAHGIVNSSDGSRHLEDIGSDYFDSLLKVSFLEDLVEGDRNGRVIVTCKMHDLVHDLSRQIIQDEILLTPKKSTNDHNQICRYLSLAPSEKVDSNLFNKLRALFVTGGNFATDKPVKKGYCVRSIILEDMWFTSVPLFISKFEYLGYLRISLSSFQEFPEAITGCRNLQAVHVIRCFQFATLPESIGKLRKLRTLELTGTSDLKRLPQSIGDCHNLESLHLDGCSILNNVPDSLCKIGNLRLLNILKCYLLRHLPLGMFGQLPNLQTINLSECADLEVLPDSFASNQLHTLKVRGLTRLTVLPQSITCLSNLEHLDLQSCSGLVELPKGIVNLKRLVVLNLEGCSGLRGLPAGFGQLARLETLGLFVVGESSEHARISELGSLDRLSGNLNLTIDRDPDDAEKAYLKRKNNIQELDLSFGNMDTEIEQEAGMEQEAAVLNVLEPPYGIKILGIRNYEGLHLPCWLTEKTHWSNKLKQTVDLPHFHLLTSMSLGPLPNMVHLTGVVHLPSLQSLILFKFDTLESINIGPFPSLTSLSISYMPSSLELTTATRAVHNVLPKIMGGATVCDNQETQYCFPSLSDLSITYCPKLTVNPCFPASLKKLTLEHSIVCPVHPQADNLESLSCRNSNWVSPCSTLVNEPSCSNFRWIPSGTSDWEFLQHLRALEFLKITHQDEELTQLPESMRSLTTLKQLSIHQCHGLRLLPECIWELRSLQKIEIIDCKNMSKLPEVGLGGLRSLTLRSLPRLSHLPESMREYTSLQELEISVCDVVHQLPEVLGEVTSLRRLTIGTLPVLTSLPESLQGLTSLQYLSISNCDALQWLPDKLGELRFLTALYIQKLPALTCLPEFMQSLTSLRDLFIIDCDALTSLPSSIGQLRALRALAIHDCRGLTSLPRSIQRLTSLESLSMIGNPHLVRRYKREAGKDWHLISHIRHVVIRE